MTMEPDTILHVVTSLLMIAFGVGAWRGKRESAEGATAKDVVALTGRIDQAERLINVKVGWKDFERDRVNFRREVALQVDPLCERVERLERKVWNGGAG